MRQVVSVVNLKGGVGKTTSAVNIAACLGEIGKSVLLIDLDPQGSASLSLGIENSGEELLFALNNETPLPVMPIEIKGVELVPSGMSLATGQLEESGNALARCLEETPGDWEYVIIDCPPSYGNLTTNALIASTRVVVPVEASFLGLNGLKQMVSAIGSLRPQNPGLEIEAILPCRAHRRRRIHWEIMDSFNSMFPGKVSPIIRENVSLAAAPGIGKPVIYSDRLSKGADDYRFVTLWLDDRLTVKEEVVVEHSGFVFSTFG
ncbi:MAG: ParA family protein [Deltaproteobacteria bacterium]|jgi:chromosome partitioning protein|nr:ParA family protein [Deltaproteobacteria bacterium]